MLRANVKKEENSAKIKKKYIKNKKIIKKA